MSQDEDDEKLIKDDESQSGLGPSDTEFPFGSDVEEDPEAEAKVRKEISDAADEEDVDQELEASEPKVPQEESPAKPSPVIPASLSIPAVLGSAPAKNPKLDRYQQFIDQYKALQDQRRKGDMVNSLLAAGGKIGQSIAGRTSGNFNPDQSGVKMLQEMNNRPVQDFEQGQVVQGRQMQLKDLMDDHDANSSKSKLIRDYLNKRLNMNLADDVSAADAQQLLKVMGRQQSKASRTLLLTNQKTGQKMQGIYHPDTETMTDLAGNKLGTEWSAGFRDQTFVDPDTGERAVFNAGTGKNMGPITGPGVSHNINPENPGDLAKDNTAPIQLNRSFLNKEQRNQLDTTRKAFIHEVKDDRNSLNANERVIRVLEAGGEMGDLPREIQDQLNRAFGQKGHISDAQLGGLLGKPDWRNRVMNAVSLWSTGKLTDENRQFLLDVAKLIREENQKYITAKSQIYSHNMYKDFKSASNLSKYNIDLGSIQNLLSIDSASDPYSQQSGAPGADMMNAKKGEEERLTQDGKIAIFDAKSKKFLRFKETQNAARE